MANNYQEEIIKELMIKILKIAGVLLFVYILLSIVYGIVKEIKKGKTQEIKIKYTPSDITKKYPQDFKIAEEVMSKIKKSVDRSYTKTTGEDEITTYLDSRGLVVYKITQNLKIQISAQGGKGGYNFRKYPPKEEGYVYDRNGNMVNKIEGGLYSPHSKDPFKRESEFNWKKILNSIKITTIGYDNFGNKIREEQLNLGKWYEKEITEYNNGKKKAEKKIIDYEVDAEEYNKIYVEITKEYDETEKLIKKFVLRKNKFNAVRSETNFDLIKGEIITKYYDGDKLFATVTETLIGKDRAIVKREREGDDVKIFDYVEYIMLNGIDNSTKKHFYEIKNKRFVYNLNNEMMFKVEYLLRGREYNDIGVDLPINNDSYKYEGYFDNLDKNVYTKISSEINNILEIKQENINESIVIEWEIVEKDYLKVRKNIMIGKIDDITKKYLLKKSEKIIKTEEINKEFKNIFGGM